MPADHDTTALVIGGGIAGLTAAIALRQHGIDALVFEQVDDVRKSQGGSGLALHINVARAFDHLGLLDELTEVAAPIKRFESMTYKGKRLGSTPMSETELTQGILRPVFHEFLVNALGDDTLQIGAKLERFEQDDRGVTAHFADGRTARGDVLIGADGFGSTVRAQLLEDGPEPRFAGYVTRRGVLETESARDGVWRIVLGPAQRFVFLPAGHRHVYWTAVTNEPPGGKQTGAEIKRAVLERFRGWPEEVEAAVDATDESSTFLADTVDRDPVERWGEGRVTLLGDAAHPMTWDRGQGAGQGIEGAVLLANALAQADDAVAALRAWEAERIPRTTKIVHDSRRVGDLLQTEKPLLRLFRDQVVARGMASKFGIKRRSKDLLVDYGPRPLARKARAAAPVSGALISEALTEDGLLSFQLPDDPLLGAFLAVALLARLAGRIVPARRAARLTALDARA